MAEWEDAPASKADAGGWEDAPTSKTAPTKTQDGWEDAPTKPATTEDGEFVKGAKSAYEYGLPSMGRQVALQGSADAMVSRKKQLDLMGEIDSGKFKSLAELKADPAYDALKSSGQNLAILNTYFTSRNTPDVAAKLRGKTEKEFKDMAADSRAHIDMLNKYARENKDKYGPKVEKFTDINWSDPRVAADFTDWLGYNMGAGAVQMAPVMLAAVATKQPGLLATSGAMGVSEAVGNRMKFIQDQTKGMSPEQQGEAIAKYVAETGDANLLTGLVSGSFDLILGPAAKAAKAGLSKSVGKMAATKQAVKELPKDIAGEAVTGGLQESTQIAAKKILEEQGLPITMENIKDVINAATAEAAGAPVGTAVNVGMAGLTAPSAPPAADTAEAELDAALKPEAKIKPTTATEEQPTPTTEAQPEPTTEAETRAPIDLSTAKTYTDPSGTVWVMTGREEPEGGRAVGRPIWEKLSTVQAEMEQSAQDQGAANVGQPVTEPSGVSPELAGQPDQNAPAGGLAEPTTAGVVSAGENVVPATEGAGVEPTALANYEAAEAARQQAYEELTTAQQELEAAGYEATPELNTKVTQAEAKYNEASAAAETAYASLSEEQQAEPTAEEQPAPTPEPEFTVTIEPAFRTTKGGRDVRDGYDVFINGEWGNRYRTKKEAQAAVAAAEAERQQVEQAAAVEPAPVEEGVPSGIETPEAVQAEAQGQEAPAATGVTPEAAETPEQEKVRSQEELNKEWARAQDVYQKSFASTKFKNRGLKQRALEKLNPQELMQWLKSFWPVATRAQREVMARLPSIEFLGKWVEDFGLTQITQASDLMTSLLGKQKVLTEETEQLIYRLKQAFKADPTLQNKLSKLVYETTNAEVDPSDPNAKERVPQADADYAALGEEGQALYRLVKEHYEARGEEYLRLLEDNINRLQIDETQKKNLMAVLRKHYETGNRIKPYFPFVRDEGEYWLSVGKGDNKEFYIYSSMMDRDADRARIISERGLSADDTAVGNSVDSLRQSTYEASALLRGVFDAIDSTPAQQGESDEGAARYKESLKDAVYQTYLNVMPERSFRGMFKHRKGRAGFRTDLIQNIATTDGKMNIQLARLEFAQQIRDTVDAAQSAIEGREDLQPFVDELRKRVDMFVSPAPHNAMDAVAGMAGRIGFIYMLGGLSLPLLQPLALASSGLPILYGNYKQNPATVGAALFNALLNIPTYGFTSPMPDGSLRYHWPSLVNSKTLTGDEKRAVQALAQSGVHESTLAREVWNHASTPTSRYVKEPGKEAEYYAARTMKGLDTIVGSPFHIMEKWTREALFLAAYRLGIKDGLGHDAAVKKAFDNIKEALGDYDTHAKPRWMQRGLGKMAFALKTFAVLITQQTLGNLFKAIPLLNKEGKAEAIKKFSGIMITMGLLAGASGVPLATVFYSFAAGLVMAMGAEDDESEDEAELREMDRGLWFRSVWLPKHIPDTEIGGVKLYDWLDRGVVNAITGLDVASRLQLATIWGQETPKPAKTPLDAALTLAKDYFAGAYFGLIEQWANAYNAYSLGDDQKAMELVSPKAIKDWLRADRYEEEGVQVSGKEVIPQGDLTALELWGQRIGFTPDIVSTTQKEGMKASAALEKVRIERDRLLTKLDIAARKDTPEADAEFERIMDEVDEFNEKYPSAALNDSDVNHSLRMREKVRDDAIAGVTVTKKQADALGPLLDRMERRLEERNEKMRK